MGLVGAASQLVLSRTLERTWRQAGLSPVVERSDFKLAYQGGVLGAGMAVPLLLHVVALCCAGRVRWLTVAAALAALAGGYAERALILFAGNRSADLPRLYLDLAQPGSSAATPVPPVVEAGVVPLGAGGKP